MKYSICLTMFLLSSVCSAGVTSGWGKITRFYVNSDSTVLRVDFSVPKVNPDGCTATSWYMKEITDENDAFVSTVMAAFVAQKEVRFWIAGCTSIAYWGGTQPQLYDIEVKP